ncbi:hypothetical protein QT381_09855 [Galbitalea sp. SE-J8]|uniref:hypothetical protein n=1 Tax=Galbitalea sp. SE-J8 TaxID=3054952 RepID=UPI00259CC6ED|nr:hypothetical protein [Galbitalea sp. SE-J8]MDM4763310.1 hypothetical protein [Galbitalea sp. SE-J8]
MTVSDAQTWTALGVFAAFAFGALGVMSTLLVRVLRADIARLDAKMDARFDTVSARFDAMSARFDGVDQRFDTLDRDVQALYRHTFGIDRG